MKIIFQGVKNEMEKEKKLNQFERNDGYDPQVKCDNPIQETWVHKQVVKRTGDFEDDWILEEKPVLVDSVDIHKSIQEEAKTTDLKYLLKQLLQTGDESILNRRQGFYGDVSMFGDGHSLSERKIIDLEDIKKQLPEEMIKGLSDEDIAKLTEDDVIKYYQLKIAEVEKNKEPEELKKPEEKGNE